MRNNDDAIRVRTRMAVADGLRLPDRARRARAAQHAACAAFEDAWQAARPAVERDGPIACAPGCAMCCHQHVAVCVVEAVAIAGELAARPELAARLAAAAPRIACLAAPERRRARLACPFLEPDGRCAIYAVRPLRCRGLHSRDAAICRAQTERPNEAARERDARHAPPDAFPLAPVRIADAALAGLAAAQRDAGIAGDTLEMVAALALLLASPERGQAAMAGMDDLAESRLDPAQRQVAAAARGPYIPAG
jgi:Fe-S-cluster containining protein